MEQFSKPECKNMDACLRRLKQELTSMKEAGDGLHAQMNSMMGALQELKVLQVQTALENLDISGRPINRGMSHPAPPAITSTTTEEALESEKDHGLHFRQTLPEDSSPSLMPSPRSSLGSRNTFTLESNSSSRNRSSLGTSSFSASSLQSEVEGTSRTAEDENDLESVPKRWSGYTAPQVDFYGPMVGNPPPELCPHPQPHTHGQAVDLPGILYSLSREGPSLDSDYSPESTDDASDWTSSLMSRSRNRQPLVLGDNVFADLVGNWLDLPEVEREEVEEEARKGEERTVDGGGDRPDTPAHPLRLSRSQEICKRFSLTTNIFKKFLRTVRPDRDKLLKERPGWIAPDLPEGDLYKRPKKMVPKSSKGSFYLPFWSNGQQSKGRPGPCLGEPEKSHQHRPHHFPLFYQHPFAELYVDGRQPETGVEKMQPLFDYNTAVWV
ncbi:PAK4-inhibitor INKA2 isoform X1 [Solea solea]|uniref:PAK4-inhibitor INKA2 isoform X1 n=2 Tax=Solea solea TaxID=90069 RepID=UPI00272D03FF|nr:PAK4-inhibitor INKA2 isoform X1 [Solea solea]